MIAKKISGKVVKKELLSGETWFLEIELAEDLNLIPGQFVSLKVSEDGLRRSYSVAGIKNKTNIDLIVDVSPMGLGSKYILSLSLGSVVEVLGPLGRFTIDDAVLEDENTLMFVGTGTGMVPLKMMIDDLLFVKDYKQRVVLVWGMRHENELYWQKELRGLSEKFENFTYHLTISKPTKEWAGMQGRVGDVLSSFDEIWSGVRAYLCGNPEMIEETKEFLIDKGVDSEKIKFERFA